jgi:hypothetical protein
MHTHHSPLAAATVMAFALSVVGLSAGMPGMWRGRGPMGPGWRGRNPQMLQQRWGMMQQNVQSIETHLANIEALLRELVQLQKGQKTR